VAGLVTGPPADASVPGAAGPSFAATIAALAIGQLLCWAALYYAFSSFVLPMMRELGWTKATVMGAFTAGLAAWGLASYASGAAIDRGHGRAVMTLGAVLGALACAAWSRVEAPWQLYASCIVLGVAMAMTLYEPAFNVVTHRYPTRYREAITALTLVAGFASTLSFPACAWLIGALGWRGAMLAVAASLLLVAAPLQAWALRGTARVAAPPRPDAAADATLRQAVRHPAFWLLTLCFTLHAFVAAALWAHVMPAFTARGVDETATLAVLVWIGPAQVAGRLAFASIGRALPLRRVGLFALAAMAIAFALFAASAHPAALLGFALLFGAGNGLVTIVRGGLVPAYFGRTHVGRVGGLMSAVSLLARAAAPLAAAWLLLLLPGYRELMLVLAGIAGGAWLAFLAARPPGPAASGPQ
jgi:MFS family permease